MTTTTTAAVLRAPDGPFTLEQVTLADLAPHEVLVRIVGVGFCHTDLMPRGMAAHALPAILGHEGSGVVAEVGSAVTRVTPGEHVVLSFASCGACAACRRGTPAYCADFLVLNMSGRDAVGGTSATDASGAAIGNRWFGQSSFAGHAIVHERGVVPVDPELPLELLGPLGCGIQTGAGSVLNEMDLQPGQTIAVFGAGAVGLAAVMAAKLAGASDIVAVDLHESRLELAKEAGATRVVPATSKSLVDRVIGGTGGLDFALDTTAVGSVMETAIEVVGVGGEVVLVGAGLDGIAVHPSMLTGKKVGYVLEGGADPQVFIPQLLGHWRAGRFPFDRLIRTYQLSEIGQAEADSRAGSAIKPVLLVGAA